MSTAPKSKIQKQRDTLDDIIHDRDTVKLKTWWRETRRPHVTLKIFLHSLHRGLLAWKEGLEETIIFLQETMPQERKWKAFLHEAGAEDLRITLAGFSSWDRRKTLEAKVVNLLQMSCKYTLDEPPGMASFLFWQTMQGLGDRQAPPTLDLQGLQELDFQKLASLDDQKDSFRQMGGSYCLWLRHGLDRNIFERHLDSRVNILTQVIPGFALLQRQAIWDLLGDFTNHGSQLASPDGKKAWQAMQDMGQAVLEKQKLQGNLGPARAGKPASRRI